MRKRRGGKLTTTPQRSGARQQLAADWFGELRRLQRGRYSEGAGVEAYLRRERGAACCPASPRD